MGKNMLYEESSPIREDLLPSWDKGDHGDQAGRGGYEVRKSSSI